MRVARAIAVAVMLALFLLGGHAFGADADAKNTPDGKATDAANLVLEQKLPNIRFNSNTFADVIDYLCDVARVNIYVDYQSLASVKVAQDTPVTYSATNKRFGDALCGILSKAADDPGKLVYCTDGGVIFISTPDAQKLHRESWEKHRNMPTDRLKSDKPTLHYVHFNANKFSDVLDFLGDITGDDIKMDWDQMHTNGIERDIPITLDLRDAQTLLVLQLVAESASSDKAQVDYKIGGGAIEFFATPKKQNLASPAMTSPAFQ